MIIEEYPQSKYSKEVQKLYESTARFLKIDPVNNIVNNQ